MLKNSEVQEFLMDITDNEKNCIMIIECILKGKTSDAAIAEETEIKLNSVRKILNKLYDAGVASYKRSKDPETNFEIYNWKFEQKKLNDLIIDKQEDLLKEIERSLKYEKDNMFFACKANGHRYIYEDASEYNFVCPQCGESLAFQDNTLIIGELLNKKAKYEAISKTRTKNLSYIN
jgi:transcription initiation factor TFIIE subunit alpha